MNEDMKLLVVGGRQVTQDGAFVQCPGCARWFMGVRGLRAHQSARFQAMDCLAVPERSKS